MNRRFVANTVGAVGIVTHLFVIVVLVVIMPEHVTAEDRLGIILVLAPIFLTLTVLYAKYIVVENALAAAAGGHKRAAASESRILLPLAVFVLGTVGALAGLVSWQVWSFIDGADMSARQLETNLGLIELCWGILIGLTIDEVFRA